MKTRKSAAKRYKLTAGGKVKVKKSNLRHLLSAKTPDQKRAARKAAYLFKGDAHNAIRALPYGSIL